MTELTNYICDMCKEAQELNTSPQRMETNYVRFIGMVSNLDKDLSIQALCPKCAGIVGSFIKNNRKLKLIERSTNSNKKQNRVSTVR